MSPRSSASASFPPPVTPLGRLSENGPEVSLLRLDQLHAEAPGNKWYKLRYNLLAAADRGQRTILTFGGPWSNHIAATAATCHAAGLKSIGVIRGEEPPALSDTLRDARAHGMELHFVSRAAYARKDTPDFLEELRVYHGDVYIIPEGGSNAEGVRGCGEILSGVATGDYTHIAVAVGTGATVRGIAASAGSNQRVWGFLALKGGPDTALRDICRETGERTAIITDYAFGGFARATPGLLTFMQEFRKNHGVLLDFVYTAKMMYGITMMGIGGLLGPMNRVLAVHTGGLQGNRSLDPALGLCP